MLELKSTTLERIQDLRFTNTTLAWSEFWKRISIEQVVSDVDSRLSHIFLSGKVC